MVVTSTNTYFAAWSVPSATDDWIAAFYVFQIPAGVYSPLHSCSSNGGTGNTTIGACTIYNVGSNHLLVGAYWITSTGTVTVSDTFGSTWHLGAVCTTGSGGSTHRLTYVWTTSGTNSGTDRITSVTGSSSAVIFTEYSVGPPALDADTCSNGTSGSPSTVNSGNITTTYNGDLLIGIGDTEGTGQVDVGSGYTFTTGVDSTLVANAIIIQEQQVSGAAGTYSSSTVQGTAGAWMQIVAAFRIQLSVPRHPSGIY